MDSIWTINKMGDNTEISVYCIKIPLDIFNYTSNCIANCCGEYLSIFDTLDATLKVYYFGELNAQIYNDTELYEGIESANEWIACLFDRPAFATHVPITCNRLDACAMSMQATNVFILNINGTCTNLIDVNYLTHDIIDTVLPTEININSTPNLINHYLNNGTICLSNIFYCNCGRQQNCLQRRQPTQFNKLDFVCGFYPIEHKMTTTLCILAKLCDGPSEDKSNATNDPDLLRHYVVFVLNDNIQSVDKLFQIYFAPDIVAEMIIRNARKRLLNEYKLTRSNQTTKINVELLASFNAHYKMALSEDTMDDAIEDFYMKLSIDFPKKTEYCLCGF